MTASTKAAGANARHPCRSFATAIKNCKSRGSSWRQKKDSACRRQHRQAVTGMYEVMILLSVAVVVTGSLYGILGHNLDAARQHVDCIAWVGISPITSDGLVWHVEVVLQNTGSTAIHAYEVAVAGEALPLMIHTAADPVLDPGDTSTRAATYDAHAAAAHGHPRAASVPPITVKVAGPADRGGLCEVIRTA